jgi:phosphatidylglycerophosphate synthase
MKLISGPKRQNRSFLAEAEQLLIKFILPRLPREVASLHLTVVGLVGAFIASIGLIGCRWSLWWLPAVVIGVSMNWFGDSLDGSLARFRQEQRPRFGFLVDHTADLFSQIIMIVAFGFSPFLSLISALTIIICFLLFSAYTYIRAAAHHIHQMSYIGVGATEFRIMMIVWALMRAAFGANEQPNGGFTSLDITIMVLAGFAIIGLGIKATGDARVIAEEEGATPWRLSESDGALASIDVNGEKAAA